MPDPVPHVTVPFDSDDPYVIVKGTGDASGQAIALQSINGQICYYDVTVGSDGKVVAGSAKEIAAPPSLDVPSLSQLPEDQLVILDSMLRASPSLTAQLGSTEASEVHSQLTSLISDPNTSIGDLFVIAQSCIVNLDISALMAVIGQLGLRIAKEEQKAGMAAAKATQGDIEANQAQQAASYADQKKELAKIAKLNKWMAVIMIGVAILAVIVAIIALAMAISSIVDGGVGLMAAIGLITALIGLIAALASLTVTCVQQTGGFVPDWVTWMLLGVSIGAALVTVPIAIFKAVAKVVEVAIEEAAAQGIKAALKLILQEIGKWLKSLFSQFKNLGKASADEVAKESSKITQLLSKLKAAALFMEGMAGVAQGSVSMAQADAQYDLSLSQAWTQFLQNGLQELQTIMEWLSKCMDSVTNLYTEISKMLVSYAKSAADTIQATAHNII